MEEIFLFWFYFVGLIIVACQDLKRREIDDWLNLLLLVGGCVFVFYDSFLNGESFKIFILAFLLLGVFFVQLVFYFGRVFAGGDAKLLFAMTPFFLGESLFGSLSNAGVFVLFLFIVGSVYGLGWCFVLYSKNFRKVNKEMERLFFSYRILVSSFVVVGFLFVLLGFQDFYFLLIGCWVWLFVLLAVFAKGLENVFMVRRVSGKDLVEGDWLVEDVRVGRKVVKPNFEGLSLEEIALLRDKNVLIKDGIPFGPVFVIAFLFYVFFRVRFLGVLGF